MQCALHSAYVTQVYKYAVISSDWDGSYKNNIIYIQLIKSLLYGGIDMKGNPFVE